MTTGTRSQRNLIGIIVCLFGVCAKNLWRNLFIAHMKELGFEDELLFNPVVPPGEVWTEAHRLAEEQAKSEATYLVFYLANTYDVEGDAKNTLPFYSLAEAYDALIYDPERTVIVLDSKDLSGHPAKQLRATEILLRRAEEELRPDFEESHIFNDVYKAERFLAKAVSEELKKRIARMTQTLSQIVVAEEE